MGFVRGAGEGTHGRAAVSNRLQRIPHLDLDASTLLKSISFLFECVDGSVLKLD